MEIVTERLADVQTAEHERLDASVRQPTQAAAAADREAVGM